jgi:hypothetical protein
MDATTKNLVRQRAGDCCEYCHLPQDATPFITLHIEHDAKIVGLTPTGRATARLLNMNDSRRVDLREQWLDEGGQI